MRLPSLASGEILQFHSTGLYLTHVARSQLSAAARVRLADGAHVEQASGLPPCERLGEAADNLDVKPRKINS